MAVTYPLVGPINPTSLTDWKLNYVDKYIVTNTQNLIDAVTMNAILDGLVKPDGTILGGGVTSIKWGDITNNPFAGMTSLGNPFYINSSGVLALHLGTGLEIDTGGNLGIKSTFSGAYNMDVVTGGSYSGTTLTLTTKNTVTGNTGTPVSITGFNSGGTTYSPPNINVWNGVPTSGATYVSVPTYNLATGVASTQNLVVPWDAITGKPTIPDTSQYIIGSKDSLGNAGALTPGTNGITIVTNAVIITSAGFTALATKAPNTIYYVTNP